MTDLTKRVAELEAESRAQYDAFVKRVNQSTDAEIFTALRKALETNDG